MIGKFIRHQKYKKMIKVSASFILEEFAKIVNETVEHFAKEDQIKSLEQKEVLKFEAVALIFWLFQKADIFPKLWHKLILDEIHNQYFKRLRKHDYGSKMCQFVRDDFNLRYKTYNDVMKEDQDFSRVGVKFVGFLSDKSKTNWDIKDIIIPLYISKKLTPKFKEFCDVIINKKT